MIELRRLRYLVTVALRLNYSRAAEDLGITQSALTRAIQSLEAEMGMRLLDRDQSGVTLTEQGHRVVEMAEALLVHAKDFEHRVVRTSQGQEGRVRFGMTRLAARTLLPSILAQRLGDAPGFAHEVLVRHAEELWFLLTSRDVEFFVAEAWQPADALPIRAETLGEVPVGLIVRGDHPAQTTADLQGLPLLIDTPSAQTSNLVSMLRERAGIAVQSVEDFSTLIALTKASNAVWLTSPAGVAAEIGASQMRTLNWSEELPERSLKMTMYSLERRSQASAVIDLRNAFRRRLKTIDSHPRHESVEDRAMKGIQFNSLGHLR